MSGPVFADRAWLTPFPEDEGDVEVWLEPGEGRAEYIRRDRAVLAALPEVQAIVDAAVKAEREACAWTATSFLVGDPREGIPLRFPSGVEVAAAIRKRGEG